MTEEQLSKISAAKIKLDQTEALIRRLDCSFYVAIGSRNYEDNEFRFKSEFKVSAREVHPDPITGDKKHDVLEQLAKKFRDGVLEELKAQLERDRKYFESL